ELIVIVLYLYVFFFRFFFFVSFFSSRRRHTRCLSDWSSDVCSSDLVDHHRVVDSGRDDLRVIHVAHRGEVRLVGRDAVVLAGDEIGRASCRERVKISVGAGWVKEKSEKSQRRDMIRDEYRRQY